MIYARRQELQARRWDGRRRACQVARAVVVAAFWLVAWLVALSVLLGSLVGIGILTWAALR